MTKGTCIRTALGTFVVAFALVVGVSGAHPASAQTSTEPMVPPAGIDAAHPTVSGRLIAKPGGSETGSCGDRAAAATASMRARGLVICTDGETPVLLQLQPGTYLAARYWGEIDLSQLTVGDHLNAWGVLHDNGMLLNPTYAVQDTSVQRAYTDSRDYIASRDGKVLTLMVLSSDGHGPVNGIVHAVPGGPTNVRLCGGGSGTWANLTPGKVIQISDSLFNSRTDTYIQTTNVQVACS